MQKASISSLLFRREVVLSRNLDAGEVLLVSSPSFVFFMWAMTFFAILTLFFLFTFDYARRVKVSGVLVYEDGVSRVYTSNDGIIVKKFVTEGSQVKAGDPLF